MARCSLHNNYLTLPIIFIMVSNHFPFTFGSSVMGRILTISILGPPFAIGSIFTAKVIKIRTCFLQLHSNDTAWR